MQGCCYCLAQDSDVDINTITKWPKYNGFYAKVPTCLYYKNKNKVLDWGKGAKLLALKVLIGLNQHVIILYLIAKPRRCIFAIL